VGTVMQIIENAGRPAVIAIESYNMSARGSSATFMAELGAIMRYRIIASCRDRIAEIPPASLKKFATARGNATKVEVASQLTHHYGVTFVQSDQADAYGLAHMARAISRPDQYSRDQIRTLAKIVSLGGGS
jgi:Holliday junction resolvasome RuvABC endonuclease subunit